MKYGLHCNDSSGCRLIVDHSMVVVVLGLQCAVDEIRLGTIQVFRYQKAVGDLCLAYFWCHDLPQQKKTIINKYLNSRLCHKYFIFIKFFGTFTPSIIESEKHFYQLPKINMLLFTCFHTVFYGKLKYIYRRDRI